LTRGDGGGFDLEDEIGALRDARRAQARSLRYTYVFTTGAVGPTHDDITVTRNSPGLPWLAAGGVRKIAVNGHLTCPEQRMRYPF
jgi:hypothetical protein